MVNIKNDTYTIVSTHSRPKAAGLPMAIRLLLLSFQHTAARRRLGRSRVRRPSLTLFQHTAARRRLGRDAPSPEYHDCFNTQPPEGGWVSIHIFTSCYSLFQHTAARRRLVGEYLRKNLLFIVSTHSRPKAAGAFLKSLAPSGFAAPISLSSREKREREYNTAFSVTPAFAIS